MRILRCFALMALAAAPASAEPPGPDTPLLRALLFAFAPAPVEIQAFAVEDLGLLGDVRALDALGSFLFHPHLEVGLAAVRAISAFQHPRAEALLVAAVRDPRVREPLRLRAVQALAFQRTASALRFLQDLSADPRSSASLQAAARAVIAAWGPLELSPTH